jgi:hypothetical protein
MWAGKRLGLVFFKQRAWTSWEWGDGHSKRNNSIKQLMGRDYPRLGPFFPLKAHKKLAPNSRVRSSSASLGVSADSFARAVAPGVSGLRSAAAIQLAVAASRLGAGTPPPGTPLRALGVPCSNTSPHTPIAVRPPAAAPPHPARVSARPGFAAAGGFASPAAAPRVAPATSDLIHCTSAIRRTAARTILLQSAGLQPRTSRSW